MKHRFLGMLAVLVATGVQAQIQEVVVTGMRSDGYLDVPAVTISKPADFLVQEIRLINDSHARNCGSRSASPPSRPESPV